MSTNSLLVNVLRWLPSIVIALVLGENGLGKVMDPSGVTKIIDNPIVLSVVGVILLLAVVLFLIPRTMLIGASVLGLYMTLITLIHLFKGKPFEVTAMIVVAIVFAVFIRKPELFKLK